LFVLDLSEIQKCLHTRGQSAQDISIQPGTDADPRWIQVKVSVPGAKQLPLYSMKKNKKELSTARDLLANEILVSQNILMSSAGATAWDKLYSWCGHLKLPKPTGQEDPTGSQYRFSIYCACMLECSTIEFLGKCVENQESLNKTLPLLLVEMECFLKGLPVVPSNPKPETSISAVSEEVCDYMDNLVTYSRQCELPAPQEKITSENDLYRCHLTLKGKFTELPSREHPRKKDAEKHVALFVLQRLYPECTGVDVTNAKNKLQEICAQNQLSLPVYPESIVSHSNPRKFLGIVICEFKVTGDEKATETEAKQNAARLVLNKLP
jgi:hypothetical protein